MRSASMLEEVDRLTRLVETLLRRRVETPERFGFSEKSSISGISRTRLCPPSASSPRNATRLEVTADASVRVSADRRVLRDAVTNVVDNAIKYSPSGATIAMRIEADRRRGDAERHG